MENNYHSLIEDLNEKGLISGLNGSSTPQIPPAPANIFASTPIVKEENKAASKPLKEPEIDGFDTDILGNLKYRQISDVKTKLKVKVARLQTELEELNKNIENSFLHADKKDYKKMLENRAKLEKDIAVLAGEYKKHQLKSIIPEMIAKAFCLFGFNTTRK